MPVRDWQQEPADADQRAGVPHEDELDGEGAAPLPARGQPPARGRAAGYAGDNLDDVFDEDEDRAPRRGRARAEDYSAAYQTYEDEFEEEDEPRSRAGPLVLLLALIAVALIAGGLIYWHFSQNRQTASQGSNVPVITAPKEPVKTVPETTNQQQATEKPAQLPVRHKQIYDRILGEETLEPERIVPTEETPQAPLPSQNQSGDTQNGNTTQQPQQQQGSEPLPLPLPPPPEPSGQQGSLDAPQTTGKSEPSQMVAQKQDTIAEPALVNAASDLAINKSDSQTGNGAQDLKVPEVPTAESAQKQTEALARAETQQAVQPSDQQQLQQIIETDQTPVPVPAPKPQKPKVVVKTPPKAQEEQVAVAPPPPQPRVQQPVDPGAGPIALTPFVNPGNPSATVAQQGQQIMVPQQSETPARTTTRFAGRDSDPLEGRRIPFSSSSSEPALNTQQPSDLTTYNQLQPSIPPQPVIQPQPPQQQQQVASIQPQPQPQVQSRTGAYVAQLAAFRSQADAQNEYQRLAQRHGRLFDGLSPQIQEASLGASGSFYRLSVGPLASAAAAQKLCNALISAGERDCLVRRQ